MAIIPNDTYHSLLMDYAAGTLDEAFSLVIATHLSLSDTAREIVLSYEDIGGGLLEECCAPVAMKENSLESVMRKLDSLCDELEEDCQKRDNHCAEMAAMPPCLRAYMDKDTGHLPWKNRSAGLRTITIRTRCKNSRAEIMKIDADAFIPRPKGKNPDIILVLAGALEESGKTFTRGDLVTADDNIRGTPTPSSGKDTGCICLSVTTTLLHFNGLLAAMMNRFIR